MTRSTRPDRLDRLVLTSLGLLVTLAAAYGLARGGGMFGDRAADDPLLLPSVRRFVAENPLLFWLAAAVVALLVAWLGYRWLRAQFPASKTVGQLDFDASAGVVRLDAAAAARALENDLQNHPDVRSAKARLLRARPRPDVELRVAVADDVDVVALGRWVEEEALERFGQALEVADLTARMEVRFTGPAGRSLR
ncbi:MAG TPA: hypothetical protein VHG90_04740 [Acidimicrobiales bacterium]|nr:hypothetical protein [Acidimicrobiales bacterium]